MRLSSNQLATLRTTVATAMQPPPVVRIFGSRLDDSRRGGDLDLLLESDRPVGLMEQAGLKLALEEALGLPVDLVVIAKGEPLTPFKAMALSNSRTLP